MKKLSDHLIVNLGDNQGFNRGKLPSFANELAQHIAGLKFGDTICDALTITRPDESVGTKGRFKMMKIINPLDGFDYMKSAVMGKLDSLIVADLTQIECIVDLEGGTGVTRIDNVTRYAREADHARCDGIMIRPNDAQLVTRNELLNCLFKVALWPDWRAATPYRIVSETVKLGCHYVIIGHPIVKAASPATMAKKVIAELAKIFPKPD